jgi:hypothetical protein
MIKMTQLLLAGAVALALSDVGFGQDTSPKPADGAPANLQAIVDEALAQHTVPEPLPGNPDVGVGGGVLQALPKPRDLPGSLFTPPPPPPTTGFLRVDAPYLLRDPLLDNSQFPPVGWFAGVEIQVVKPHLVSRLSNPVQNRAQFANGTSTTVALPSTPLDWTVSPRFFLGYRLPAGFGEFAVAYRFLDTMGSEGLRGRDGFATLKSRFSFNMIDLDYSNSEVSLWPGFDMKWTVGLRILTNSFDSRANQPFDQAAAGSGIFQTRDYSNDHVGFGPHAALDLAHRLGDSGWALRFRSDLSTDFTTGQEGFFTRSTTLGPTGRPLDGASFVYFHQGTSIINLQTGVTWQPSRTSGTQLFLGYQYERWFALDGVVNSGSHGMFWDQGVVMQATIHF